ncbi:MAG: hypothetical protein R6W96_07860 [Clostridia bacterium]
MRIGTKTLVCALCCMALVLAGGCKSTEVADEPSPPENPSAFRPIREFFLEAAFTVVTEGPEEAPSAFYVEGLHDLNRDGKPDHISLVLPGHSSDGTIAIQPTLEVNGKKVEFPMSYTSDGEVHLMDLDGKDGFLELAVFDEGPSADPNFKLFRYDGTDLFYMGEMDAGGLCDGDGKLISGFHLSRFEPSFYSAWFEVEDNRLVEKENDITGYLGMKYHFSGGEIFFIEDFQLSENPSIPWEGMEYLEAGDIIINDVIFFGENRLLNFYCVERHDGKKGLLYFWIGD